VIFTLSALHSKPAGLATEISSLAGTYAGLIGLALVVYFCYVYSIVFENKLGKAGSETINRLLAFVTFCIGLQISWNGFHTLIQTL
jgi:multiple antibiotic resistance protein